MANKSTIIIGGLPTIPGVFIADDGTKRTTMVMGAAVNQLSGSPSAVWASTEAADAMAFTGTAGWAGPWASTEAQDIAHFVGANAGVWASTERADSFATSSGFSRLGIESAVRNNSSPLKYTTLGPDRILIYLEANVAVVGAVNQISSITDTAGLTWHHESSLFAGQDQNSDNMSIELWWAYAHNVVTNNILSITRGSGGTTTSQSHGFAVKGLNGNYGNPFDRFENPFSYGTAIGGFFGTDTAQKAFIPYADGPMDVLSGTAPAFDSGFATGVVLSGSNLIITSSGSGNPNNYAYLNPATAGKVGGRYYFEVTFNTINGADYSAGIFYNPATFSTLLSAGVTGFMVRGSGHIFNGADVATLGVTPANGDVIAYFIDLDNGSAWARDVTQSGNWNGDATADPKYNAGGISIAPDTGSLIHSSVGGQNTALATVVGAPAGSAAAQMTFNFAGPFAGTVPTGGGEWFGGYSSGATIPFPAVNFVATTSCTPVGFGGLDTFGGFTTLTQDGVSGSQRNMEMLVQARVLSNDIQVTDNDIIQGVTTAANWLMVYNTLVPGVTDPGSLETTEAADSAHFVGHPGASGIVGDLTATEAQDIAAIVGFERDSGVWVSTEAKDIFGATGRQPLVGTLAATEAKDIFVAAGVGLGENGTWISTEGVDILTISGNTPITATFVSTEIADRFVAIGAGVTQTSRRRQLIVT